MAKQKTVKVKESLDFLLHCTEISLKKGLWANPGIHLRIPEGSTVAVVKENKETLTVAIEYENFSFEFTLPKKVFG